jgi:hypothetical protein
MSIKLFVTPAKAGVSGGGCCASLREMPAFAGMTNGGTGMTNRTKA